MRKRGDFNPALHQVAVPCIPSRVWDPCARCSRYRPDMPADPLLRPHTVVIDATTVVPDGALTCPMRIGGEDFHAWGIDVSA